MTHYLCGVKMTQTSMEDKKYTYKYPHPAVTADCVIFGFDSEVVKILLVERGIEPFKGLWALPGGFMKIDETIEQTAQRELQEETGLRDIYLEQFHTFSGIRRDPRERVITVAFIALVRPSDTQLTAGDDASDARWFELEFLPPMAFDHVHIIAKAHEYLKETLRIKPIAFKLLNKVFTLAELQRVYESIEGRTYDRRNFQRKALQSGIVAEAKPVNIPDKEYEMDIQFSRGRHTKFFSFVEDRNSQSSENDDLDGSTKDIFNF